MKINVTKLAGGSLVPFSDMDAEKLMKYKTGGSYEIDIPLSRNPKFHGKVFAFFHFCFEHWSHEEGHEHLNNNAQFGVFRNHLTVLAGYYDSFIGIHNDVRVEAKSLSFSSMSEEEFQDCYSALINAALRHVFHSTDEEVYNRLVGFF